MNSNLNINAIHPPLQTGNAAAPDHTPGQLYDLVGASTVLIPASDTQAQGMVFQVPRISFAATEALAHQQTLILHSVAAALGRESRDLCAILFQEKEILNRFLIANPVLHTTLSTMGPQGLVYWVRMVGIYPPSRIMNGVNWLADGLAVVVHGRNSVTASYKTRQSAKPIEIDFAQLRWPPEIEHCFQVDLIVIRYGASRYRGAKGRWVVNTLFWSAYVAWLLKIRYDSQHRTYWTYDTVCNAGQQRSEEWLLDQIAKVLTTVSKSPNWGYILEHQQPTRLRALLAAMKITASSDSVKFRE